MARLDPLEIQALAKIVDELDYYQILHLERSAAASDIKRAFHTCSRSFHPDTNRQLGETIRAECARISKRITEAYCVLRDPRRRKAYDDHLGKGDGLRMQLSEARAAHAKQEVEVRQGRTPQGRQFYQKANDAMKRGDWAGAVQNLQMALTFEPDNVLFKDELTAAKASKKKAG